LQESAKTLYGFPAPPIPAAAKPPGARTPLSATLLAPSAKLPPPKPRLPTEDEARQNPNLVITLEPARPATAKPPRASAGNVTPAFPGSDTTVDLPDADISVDLSPRADTANVSPPPEGTPTDLPPPGGGRRFDLPEPAPSGGAYVPGQSGGPATGNFAERLAADVRSVISLLAWAATTYLRNPKPFFLLAAILVLPASFLQSCLITGVAIRPPSLTLAPGITTVDFSARKAELAARIQDSQARGQIDQVAVAELAALTSVESTRVPIPKLEVHEGAGWLYERLALFIQGLLILGLAFPAACGVVALALYDRESGAAFPVLADVWPILFDRRELFLISLLPAALLVALGTALFVLPGLVLSVLLLFVPHVVLFEKKGGRTAFRRSIELVKSDATRAVLTFLTFALAGAVVAVFTELLLPTTGSRALAFLHFLSADLLAVALLPMPAMVLARLYLDLRARSGADPERLSRAARS